jgi:hypothetical protein
LRDDHPFAPACESADRNVRRDLDEHMDIIALQGIVDDLHPPLTANLEDSTEQTKRLKPATSYKLAGLLQR